MKRILRHVGAKDFRKTHQRKLDEQRALYLERREEEIQEEKQKKNIEEAAKPFKSDWRRETLREFGEWAPIEGSGPTNSTSQTFGYYVGGELQTNFETEEPITYTVSGLGGIESVPTTTTIDYGFGEVSTVDAPTYNQLAMQGYAKPLGGVQRQTQQTENERIDAEIRKLEEQIKQVTKLQYEYADKHSSEDSIRKGIINAEWDAYHQALKDIYAETNASFELFEKEKSELGPGPGPNGEHQWNRPETESEQAARIAAGGYAGSGGTWTFGAGGTVTVGETSPQLSALLDKHQATLDKLSERTMALWASKDKMRERHDKESIAHKNAYDKKNNSFKTQKDALRAKIVELEKQRPINQQLDASQQAYPNLPFMNARVQDAPEQPSFFDYDPSKMGREVAQVAGPIDSILDKVADMVDKKPAKKVFDYYNDVFLKNLSSNPPGSNPSNSVDMTKMMDKKEMNLIQSVVDTVMSDVNLTRQVDRETAMDAAFAELTKTIFVPTGIPGFNGQSTATPNTRNIIGTLDTNKNDGFYIQKDGTVILRKSYDFDMKKAGDNDFAASGGVGGIGAAVYASFKGTRGHLSKKPVGASLSRKTAMGGETPTMHLHIVFTPTKKKKDNESTWDRIQKHLKGD